MNEDEYQLGIRDLSKHDLVTLVHGYRAELREVLNMLIYFNDQDLIHRNELVLSIFDAIKERTEAMIADYNKILEDYRGR